MPLLTQDISLSPFMSDSQSLSVGLNPLGIRTASEQLFTTLLPGMNVVTLRIRYYSFYCWILKMFYADRENADLNGFRKHIRVSELLVALIHAQCNRGLGVPGINYATNMIAGTNETIDVLCGAMPGGKPTGGYWKGALGAFGTYYASSLQEIGLIAPLVENTRLYNITKEKNAGFITGERLADSFEQNIGKRCSSLFMTCVRNGIVSRNELLEMADSFLSRCMNSSQERDMLTEMLLQKDRPSLPFDSYMRRNTILLLLKYLVDNGGKVFSELEFARFVYDEYKKRSVDNVASLGWYAYYLNDSRQYEALIIFAELLKRLLNSNKAGQWEDIKEFTNMLADEVCNQLGVTSKTLEEVLRDWKNINCPEEKMAEAFYRMFDDYVRNKEYQSHRKLLRQFFMAVKNDVIESFEDIENHFAKPFHDYIKLFLTDNIIYSHYSEAMRKYAQNGIPTQKLTIENGLVRGLEGYEATHSSPRISTLFNFVTDIGLVRDNKLTHEGINLMRRLEND